MSYQTVFDVTERGYEYPFLPLVALLFVGLGIAWWRLLHRSPAWPQGAKNRIVPGVMLWFGAFVISVFSATGFLQHERLRSRLRAGDYVLVEGLVVDFRAGSPEQHVAEQFRVDGHFYSYSDYIVTPGFHRTRSRGGPLREGRWVRIADIDGEIARLEIATEATR
ncbi:MAG: hypothetical protein NTV05_14085 [Acidobacteria bacterium]|nr:hypothetical protein [Acidobacteriota bacterium]